MRSIKNPFLHLDGYNCFGCAPGNTIGLAMQFAEDGEEIVSTWEPGELYAGFKGVLHGGIQATLHDEIASWVVFIKLETAGYTSKLEMNYLSPVYTKNSPLTLRSKLVRTEEKKAVMSTSLFDSCGKLCSESTAEYYIVTPHIARKMFAYPGLEAFFEQDTPAKSRP
ncbi:MAG: PaaI family thioesterase [Spirochaetes bacterium]|nr:PaaI family thioesterase [Spirochaetota bacterium]